MLRLKLSQVIRKMNVQFMSSSLLCKFCSLPGSNWAIGQMSCAGRFAANCERFVIEPIKRTLVGQDLYRTISISARSQKIHQDTFFSLEADHIS